MTLAPSAGQVSQHTHIEAIRAGQQGYIEIGAIAGDPDDIRHKRYIQRWFFLTGDNIDDLIQLISQLGAKHGNVYCSRVLYQQPRRDKALALSTRLLFLDDAPPGSYTYTVETSPQSMHAYILLDELIYPDQAEQLGRRLAYQQGADQGGWDITQIVRIPGTLNTKVRAGGRYDDKRHWIPGTGHQITLTKRTGRAYSVAEITEATENTPAFPIDALDPSSVAVWHGNIADLLTPDGLPKRWKNPNITGWKVLRGEIQTKSSSEARYKVISSLVLHGYPDDEIAAIGIHLTNFGKMETKGSDWLYRDIARCTRKARADFAKKGWEIPINPTRPGRTRAPLDLPRKSPDRRGRKCKGSPASYLTRLLDEASADRVLWTLSQAAAAMGVGVATIKRWEQVLKAQGQIERVTVSTRQHSYLAILGQLIIPESAQNQAASKVSSQIEVQRVLTPSNEVEPCNTKENHRGASRPPVAPSVAPAPSSAPAVWVLDEQADVGASCDVVEDQANAASADPSDDQTDSLLARVELVCGAGIAGPVGAFAIVGGAAYVPSGAEPWYAGICAAVAPLAPDQAGARQFVVSLDDQADDLAEGAGVSYERAADQIEYAPDRPTRRRRKRKDPIQEKLDKWRQQVERWQRMDIAELEVERYTLGKAAQDRTRSLQQRETIAQKLLPQLDIEIGRKRSAGIQAMYQASGNAPEPPTSEQAASLPTVSEQAAPAPGVVRRVWRSPVVRCDWEPEPFVPKQAPPRSHPIAELGTNPESMRAAHEYCEAVLARARDEG